MRQHYAVYWIVTLRTQRSGVRMGQVHNKKKRREGAGWRPVHEETQTEFKKTEKRDAKTKIRSLGDSQTERRRCEINEFLHKSNEET